MWPRYVPSLVVPAVPVLLKHNYGFSTLCLSRQIVAIMFHVLVKNDGAKGSRSKPGLVWY